MSSYSINAIHERLKEKTHLAHRKLDNSALLLELMSPNLTIKMYTFILGAMREWFMQSEVIVEKLIVGLDCVDYLTPKSPLLADDLCALTSRRDSMGNTNTEAIETLSSINDHYKALGLFYVMEGSTLGGMVIAPKVAKVLNRQDITAFYNCYGLKKRENFGRSMGFLASSVSTECQVQKVEEGAQIAFSSLCRHLSDKYERMLTTAA